MYLLLVRCVLHALLRCPYCVILVGCSSLSCVLCYCCVVFHVALPLLFVVLSCVLVWAVALFIVRCVCLFVLVRVLRHLPFSIYKFALPVVRALLRLRVSRLGVCVVVVARVWLLLRFVVCVVWFGAACV